MKTIKIIDLLNKIANGETPKIKLGDEEYFYNHGDYRRTTDGEWLFANEIINLEDLNNEVEILDEEDEFEDIEEITLEGQVIGYGILSKWLGSGQTDKEKKLCSAIECLGTGLNQLIKNQKKIIEKLNKE